MHRFIAAMVIASALLWATRAHAQTAEAPKSTSKLDVELKYESKEYEKYPGHFHAGVYVIGFYPFFGGTMKTAPAFADTLDATFTYAGKPIKVRAAGLTTRTPTLKIDATGKGAWDEIAAIGKYVGRRPGYAQAYVLTLAEGRRLKLTVKAYAGRKPRITLTEVGAWRGTISVGEKKYSVACYDRGCDGSIANDPIWIDADGDGKVVKIEQVKAGETVIVDGRALTFDAPKDGKLRVGVAPAEGSGGRDLTGALATAPLEGKRMPDFEFVDQSGKTVSLKSLRGKVVFVNFWAVW